MRTAVGFLERDGAGRRRAKARPGSCLRRRLRWPAISTTPFASSASGPTRSRAPAIAREGARRHGRWRPSLSWKNRRIDAARRWVTRGIDAARALRSDSSLVRLLDVGATMANLRGDHARAQSLLEEAEQVAPVPDGTARRAGGAEDDAARVRFTTGAGPVVTTVSGRGVLRIPYHSTVQSLDPCLEPERHARRGSCSRSSRR